MKLIKYTKQVFKEFSADNIFKYSASLSYYTVFSIAPLLIIVITMSGFFFGKEAVQGEVYSNLNELIGSVAAIQIQDIIKNTHLTGNSFIASAISIIVLLVASTTVFGEIQDSLNKIWGLRIKTKKTWWKLIITRLLSFSLILSLGFILIISVMLNAIVSAFGNLLDNYFHISSVHFIEIADYSVGFLVSVLLFSLLFKILPDAKIRWKDVLVGGFVTAVFFTIGKFGISFYLSKSSLTSIYGAAGSIVVLMLWVYYSSIILYLGAEFTKVYAKLYGGKIKPNEYAEWVKVEEKKVVQPQLKHKDLN